MTKQAKIVLFACLYIMGIVVTNASNIVVINILLVSLLILLNYKKLITSRYTLVLALIYIVGISNTIAHTKTFDDLSSYTDNIVTVEAKVLNIPSNCMINKTGFFARVTSIQVEDEIFDNIDAKTMVTIKDEDVKIRQIKIGDNLKLTGRLKEPQSAKNPSQFDYARYLQMKNTFSLLYVEDDWAIESHDMNWGWRFLRKLNDKRNEIINIHAKNIKSPMLEILGGIIFGDDAINPDEETKTNFINSGIFHILAASGMNVTLIFGIWFFFARTLKLNYRFSIFSGILLILFYTCMTGFGPPIIRASVMLTLILIGKLIDRQTSTISILFLVGFLMLLFNPLMLYDIGFQLSFVVTFALILTAPLLVFDFKYKVMNYLLGACCVPIIAQIFAAPFQLYYFNTFAIYSVFANIAIIPVLSLVSFVGFISSILALLPLVAQKICYVADFVLSPFLTYIVNVANFFSELPFSIIYFKKPYLLQIILYFIFVISSVCILRFKLKNKKILVSLFFITIVFLLSFVPLKNNSSEIIFFAVDNADATLVKSPSGKYFLIDTGKLPYLNATSQAKNIIVKYFIDNGIKELDSLILTHFDSDHAGGAIDILKNINTKNLYVVDSYEDTNLSLDIFKYLKNEGKEYNVVSSSVQEIYKEKNFSIKLVRTEGKFIKTENQKSIITLVETESEKILLMGDGDIYTYNALPQNFKEDITIHKVGHHGAKSVLNDEMIKCPNLFIISTGLNVYNHPNNETLELLNKNGKRYLRTDYNNAIKLKFINDKRNMYMYSAKDRRFLSIK